MGAALPFIPLALTVGSAALSGIQKQQYQDALIASEQQSYLRSKAAREAETGRQDAFAQQANQRWNTAREATSPAANQGGQDAAIQRFMELYDARGTTQPEGQYLSGQDTATDTVKSEIAKRAAVGAQDARSRVQALAKVGSFDAAMQQSGLELQQAGSDLNTLGGKRRGSLSVAGQEGNVPATQVYQGNNLLGELMGAAGSFGAAMTGTPGGFGGYTVNSAGAPKFNYGPFSNLFSSGKL